jgi:hypothetical protein
MTATDYLLAQEALAPTDSLFIVTYTTGPSWDTSKSPGDQPYFKDHSANLGNWRKGGLIKFGARYSDKGIIFLSAPTIAAARKRVEADPAIINGLFKADVQRLQPFYYGCVEKSK